MPKIVPGGSSGWLGETNTPVANTLGQWSAIVSALRQLVGNANIASGSAESTDPITAPFHLYYDWDIGRDTYVTGDFNSFESSGTDDEIIAQKLKRLRNQKLECGYSRHAPFKTLNRLALEAYIITSLNWYTYTDERAHRDCVIIHAGSGPQPLFNHPGNHASAVAITPWTNDKVPTWQELIKFNDNILGGVILPRGCAFDGEDLRKTSLVAQWAPEPADIALNYSNIRCSLYLTPDAHTVDFTFRDPIGQNQSLHLLYDIGFPSQAHLDGFYAKAFTALGSSANLSAALSQARASEYQTVGPFAGAPTADWDTVRGASPYPERISSRSEWGRGGLFINGDDLGGLKTAVTAQYTGVSLQKDKNSLQVYLNGSWVTPSSYQSYIDADPNNRRINPRRAHHHILAINDASVSDVSVFSIGHAFRCKADRGGEIVSSNGNHTFGSCAALAVGYKRAAFPQDKGWAVDRIRVPLNPSEKAPAIRRIPLGKVASHSATAITLQKKLEVDSTGTTPLLLAGDGYSLKANTYVWVSNPSGDDWRAMLSAAAWVPSAPTQVNISAALSPSGTNGDVAVDNIIGKEIYIRRLVDSRTLAERTASLELVTTVGSRTPMKSAILQTAPDVPGGGITRYLQEGGGALEGGAEVLSVSRSIKTTTGARLTIQLSSPTIDYTVGSFYRKGVTVNFADKHYIAQRNLYATTATPAAEDWDEIYLHMPASYNPPYPNTEEAPQIVFDTDTDPSDNTASCGIDWATVFTNAGAIRDQHRSGSSIQGLHGFLVALGFGGNIAYAALEPRTEATRRLDPASATDFPTAPSGGAASGLARWAVEFRRSSTITLSNFTYDQGAGRGNYSTALPRAQQPISASNLFSLYFTVHRGGRVIVRGVNEEGQAVTNQGLTDAETGDITLAGDVGGGEDSIPPTSFSDITISGLTGQGAWDLSGVTDLQFSSAVSATTLKFGPIKLANAQALRSDYSIAGGSDAALDINISSTPEVVTLKGLNYWAQKKGVLTRRTNIVTLYVVPNNATVTNTYVFDGTSAVLTLSPSRTGQPLLDAPPLTRENAVVLASAIEYANITFSEYEEVNYQLANGPYWKASAATQLPAFLHIANVIGATSAFPDNAVVANYTAAATKPSTDAKAIHDARSPYLAPCFGTGLNVNINTSLSMLFGEVRPLELDWRYGGSIKAVCYLSVSATLADTSTFPSSMFGGGFSAYRTSDVSLNSYLDNAINALIPASYSLESLVGRQSINVGGGTMQVSNVIFGAKSPAYFVPANARPCTIFAYGSATIVSGGIYFLGNSTVSLPLSSAKGLNVSNFVGSANTSCYISSESRTRDNFSGDSGCERLVVRWDSFSDVNPVGNFYDRNFNRLCLHILDDNGNYGLVSNAAASNGSKGAALAGIFGGLNPGSTLVTGGLASWQTGFTNSNKHHGIAGAFGNHGITAPYNLTGAYGIIPQPDLGMRLVRVYSWNNSLFQMATTGALLTSNVTLTAAAGQSQLSYNASSSNGANMTIQAFYRGVDTGSGQSVVGSPPGLADNRFFG